MKIISIVGARPQFIKAAAVSRVLRQQHAEVLIHTGQHYDHGMSQVFFDELDIPTPDINLGVGSGLHAEQTAAMLQQLEPIMLDEAPDWVLVYGDTNSTLAGALAAAKIHIPVAHVEAGLRSFNKAMPEEINRVLTDHVSDLLFCPTQTAVQNLANENITQGVHQTGDVMYDAVLYYARVAEKHSTVLADMGLTPRSYVLATIHRPVNTDTPKNLKAIIRALGQISINVVFPVHPRTCKVLEEMSIQMPTNVHMCTPVGYLDMIQLEREAQLILTDSGGIQKEAYFFRVPCVTLREETEWIETVETGWNALAGADENRILKAVHDLVAPTVHPDFFGNGDAASIILRLLSRRGETQ